VIEPRRGDCDHR